MEYLMVFAKVTMDRSDVVLDGYYFGGVGDRTAVDELTRNCLNANHNGTIIPKIVELTAPEIIDAVYDALDKLERLVLSMREAGQIIGKNRK